MVLSLMVFSGDPKHSENVGGHRNDYYRDRVQFPALREFCLYALKMEFMKSSLAARGTSSGMVLPSGHDVSTSIYNTIHHH